MHYIDERSKNGSIISWLTSNANSTMNDFSRQESHGVGTIQYPERHSPTRDPHGHKCPNATPDIDLLYASLLGTPVHRRTKTSDWIFTLQG